MVARQPNGQRRLVSLKCSWKSGQDGSKRFLIPSDDPGAVSDYVRTVDIESAMAEAFRNMVLFAEVSGNEQDRDRRQGLADKRVRVYPRIDVRKVKTVGKDYAGILPDEFSFRIPGVSNEFWPIHEGNPCGAENYSCAPRCLCSSFGISLGFARRADTAENEFELAPALPADWLQSGKKYGVIPPQSVDPK